jgi:hemerythrin
MIFRTTGKDGVRTYAHFADIISLDVLRNMINDDDQEPGVSRELYNQVSRDYLDKADLKKIDIGGGMIHGNAEDFREDTSDKIVLSHTALKLTDRQKEIGSGAPFGMVDVLIPGYQDYVRMYAYYFLKSYFPSVPSNQLRMLMNTPLVTFNPESILMKTGTVNNCIYLILSGEVEMIYSTSGIHNTLSAGGLVGEISVLDNSPSMETYRAANFVHALQMPGNLYLDFVKNNGLYREIRRLQERREFLQKTWLFGESISYPIQNKIAKTMQLHTYNEGQEISMMDSPKILIVKNGKIPILIGSYVIETLHHGDFFGEGHVLFNSPCVYKARINNTVEIYHIQADVLLDIPVVRLKLFETFKKRMEIVLNPEMIITPVFTWRDEYNINIEEMDNHHKEMFNIYNNLYEAVRLSEEKIVLKKTLVFLIDFTKTHFTAEEELFKLYDYPEYESHRKKHEHLINDILEIQRKLEDNEMELDMGFIYFLKDWIINHVLTEDRKYGRFLHEKGVVS